MEQTINNNQFIGDGMNAFERNVKRSVDCFLALLALIIFSPLFLICYIAVRWEDGTPVIFKQERIGRFGRPFNIYKFRSMRLDAEKFGPALYKGDSDPRMTRVGKFLREYHLDELPQLWNVFIGDMAFIGPRPERKFYIDQIMEHDPRYHFLYQIRPGLLHMLRFTMAIQIRWKKCSVVYVTTYSIWNIVHGGSILRYW